MKKFFIMVALVLGTMTAAVANDSTSVKYEVVDNVYKSVKQSKPKAVGTPTPYFQEIKGQNHPILLSSNGRAYVIRISQKTGNEYKYYLGEEISRDICAKMNIEYVEEPKQQY